VGKELSKFFGQLFSLVKKLLNVMMVEKKEANGASFLYKNVRLTFSQKELSFNLTVLMTLPLNVISIFSIC
jgi:hypothetical protein